MQTSELQQWFLKTAETYYYGDHITGDLLLASCVSIFSKLFVVEHLQQQVLDIIQRINIARRAFDLTGVADILRYEIAPLLQ